MHVHLKKLLGLLLVVSLIFSVTTVVLNPQYSSAENSPRTFPETTGKTCAFADGIGNGNNAATLSDAQIQFISTHFIGDYDTPLALTQKYRQVNPSFITLLKRNGFILSPNEAYLTDGNLRGNDFSTAVDASGHEDWFYHKDQAVRDSTTRSIANKPLASSYLMNVNNQDFYNYMKTSLLQQISAGQFDGVLLDNCAGAVLNWNFSYSANDVTSIISGELGGKTWKAVEEGYLNQLTNELSTEGYKVLPMIGNQTTKWDTIDYSGSSGVFAGTVFRASWGIADWKICMNNLLKMASQDKICLFRSLIGYNPNTSTDNTIDRLNILANYLLIRGKYTYISYYPSSATNSRFYYPEFDLDVGTPKASAAFNIDNLLDASGLYIRNFTKALVVVNPSDSALQYSVPTDYEYKKATAAGNGVINTDGTMNGEVILEDISGTVQISAKSSLILIKGKSNLVPVMNTPEIANNRVKLSWNAVENATSYNIHYGTVSGTYDNVVNGVTGTQYTVNNLVNGTTYYFIVQANIADGLSDISNEVSATPQLLIPGSPQISYVVPGNKNAVVKWTPIEDTGGYILYWGNKSGAYDHQKIIKGNKTRFEIDHLKNGKECYFSVKAYNAAGSSAFSSEVPATPFAPIIRNYPKTNNKTLVFADQITESISSSNITQAQLEFIASHYVGSQKLSKSLTDRIRAINPNFLVLHYRLGIWQSAVNYITDGEHWGNDLSTVDTHEDWFMHKVGSLGNRADRLPAFDDAKLLMNISNPDFYDYFIDTSVLQAQAGGYDGIFYDSFASSTLNYYLKQITDSGFGGTNARYSTFTELGGKSWTEAETAYLKKLDRDLNQYGIKCLPNFGQLFTEWDDTDYTSADGGMPEGALNIFSGFNFYDWHLSMNNLAKMASQDKILLCQTTVNPGNYEERIFTLANYLLLRDKYTYLNVMPAGIALPYLPENDLDVGYPITSVRNGIDDLKSGSLYVRKFTKGLVIVNPSESEAATYGLPKCSSYKRLSVSGTGNIDANGQIDGTMSFQDVSGTLTLEPKTAIILVPRRK